MGKFLHPMEVWDRNPGRKPGLASESYLGWTHRKVMVTFVGEESQRRGLETLTQWRWRHKLREG